MSNVIINRISICRTPQQVFDYVTQPWKWHEWHPNSVSAKAIVDRLSVGDEFDEVVRLEPFSPLPITLMRETKYTVLKGVDAECWEVKGVMKDGWLNLYYKFSPAGDGGTDFVRTLTYDVSGLSRLMLPLLSSRMKANSIVALNNLKRCLEG